MKYEKAFNIWQLPSYLRGGIHPGQWVYAGDPNTKGQYLGQTKMGCDVVAWNHKPDTRNKLRQYAVNHQAS